MANILIADDEAIITMQLEHYVMSIGHTVIGIAYDAGEAVKKAGELKPDLVFMDVVMPGTDGLTAAEIIIKELDIPVIFLTAYGFCDYIERSANIGSCAYLVKPFKDHEVKAAIEIALHKKSVERRLIASETLYRTLVETTMEGIVQFDRDHVITFVNPAITQLTGYSPEELIGKKPEIFVFPDDIASLSGKLRERRMGRSEIYEARVRHRDGSVVWCLISAKSLIDRDGAFAGSFTVFTDISARKLSEEKVEMLVKAVEQERDNLSSMLVSTPIGMLVIDDRETVIFANSAAEDLFGRSIFDISHKRFGDIVACFNRLKDPAGCGNTPECPVCPFFAAIREALIRGSAVRDKEAMILTDDNNGSRRIWVLFSVSPFVMDKRNCAIMVVYDITERRQAQSQIMAALREKEVLLREIHHRVKNNLQIISSMYNLQTAHIKDKKVLEIFRESQNRIRSMSLIHDKLYQSKNLADVNIADYIGSLVGDLCVSYGVDSSRFRIEHSVADIDLTLDAIIPCGLIINELVSNAIKHAFPGDREGLISIRFDRRGDAYVLSVKDDGIGFSGPGLRFEDYSTLGLQLVSILTDQLEGAIELKKDRGTEFIITFKVNP